MRPEILAVLDIRVITPAQWFTLPLSMGNRMRSDCLDAGLDRTLLNSERRSLLAIEQPSHLLHRPKVSRWF